MAASNCLLSGSSVSALSVVQFSVCMKTDIDTFSSLTNVLASVMYFRVYSDTDIDMYFT